MSLREVDPSLNSSLKLFMPSTYWPICSRVINITIVPHLCHMPNKCPTISQIKYSSTLLCTAQEMKTLPKWLWLWGLSFIFQLQYNNTWLILITYLFRQKHQPGENGAQHTCGPKFDLVQIEKRKYNKGEKKKGPNSLFNNLSYDLTEVNVKVI